MPISPKDNFNSIYTQYYKKSFLFVKSYIHDDMAAEDIASESLIKLWQWMKDNPEEKATPMLLTILKNKALDYLRHKKVVQKAMVKITEKQSKELNIRISSLEECNPNEIFSNEIMNIVQNTLKSLSKQTHKIFILSRLNNKTNREIATELDISIKNVEYHISKSLKILRNNLKDYLPIFYFLY